MKYGFNIVIKGLDSLEKKFDETLKNNPNLHMDLIRAFAQTVLIAFRLNEDDNITVEHFRAGKIEEQPTQINEEIEKKLDS